MASCTAIVLKCQVLNSIMIYHFIYRVQSRVCTVPFEGPTIAPDNEEAQDSFDELDDMLTDGVVSAA